MSLVDHAKTSTLPKLLQRNAEEDPKGAGIREKTRGVWQTYSWTGLSRQRARLRAGPGGAGLQARRQAFRGGRQPPAALFRAALGPGAGRHLGAGLPGFDRLRAGLCAGPRRDIGDRGRGPGAGRQGAVAQGEAAEAALDRLRRSARPVVLRRSDPAFLRERAGGGAKVRPGQPGLLRRRTRQGRRRRHGDDRLHLGHHGQPQGGDAEPPQHDRHGRGVRRSERRQGGRQLAVVPADGLGRRRRLHAGHGAGGAPHRQLPGESRDGAARPARARAPTPCWRRRASGRTC